MSQEELMDSVGFDVRRYKALGDAWGILNKAKAGVAHYSHLPYNMLLNAMSHLDKQMDEIAAPVVKQEEPG